MTPFPWWRSSALILSFVLLLPSLQGTTTFTFVNRCNYTVWPGIKVDYKNTKFNTTGFELLRDSSRSLQVPTGGSGSFWGRTGCNFDESGYGFCLTGDCGSGHVQCNGSGPSPPATLGEFTLDIPLDIRKKLKLDTYHVSLEDGFNVPMNFEAIGGSGSCGSAGCILDLNRVCPHELRWRNGEGCMSPCQAFGRSEYCCSGEYVFPDRCRPNVYTEMFRSACPLSISHAFDDDDTLFSCTGADFLVTFCPFSTFSSI